jgi:hypothetical protein
MSNVGRKVHFTAQAGVIVAEKAGKRGKTLVTVKLADREVLVDMTSVDFDDEPKFAAPVPFAELVADYRRDNLRRRALMGI